MSCCTPPQGPFGEDIQLYLPPAGDRRAARRARAPHDQRVQARAGRSSVLPRILRVPRPGKKGNSPDRSAMPFFSRTSGDSFVPNPYHRRSFHVETAPQEYAASGVIVHDSLVTTLSILRPMLCTNAVVRQRWLRAFLFAAAVFCFLTSARRHSPVRGRARQTQPCGMKST